MKKNIFISHIDVVVEMVGHRHVETCVHATWQCV